MDHLGLPLVVIKDLIPKRAQSWLTTKKFNNQVCKYQSTLVYLPIFRGQNMTCRNYGIGLKFRYTEPKG